jgi:hypothetical protein
LHDSIDEQRIAVGCLVEALDEAVICPASCFGLDKLCDLSLAEAAEGQGRALTTELADELADFGGALDLGIAIGTEQKDRGIL